MSTAKFIDTDDKPKFLNEQIYILDFNQPNGIPVQKKFEIEDNESIKDYAIGKDHHLFLTKNGRGIIIVP